jgi:hypothetical protein
VPEAAPELLAEAMKAVLSNPTKAAEMGVAGREYMLSRFDVRVQGRMLATLYKSILS